MTVSKCVCSLHGIIYKNQREQSGYIFNTLITNSSQSKTTCAVEPNLARLCHIVCSQDFVNLLKFIFFFCYLVHLFPSCCFYSPKLAQCVTIWKVNQILSDFRPARAALCRSHTLTVTAEISSSGHGTQTLTSIPTGIRSLLLMWRY